MKGMSNRQSIHDKKLYCHILFLKKHQGIKIVIKVKILIKTSYTYEQYFIRRKETTNC